MTADAPINNINAGNNANLSTTAGTGKDLPLTPNLSPLNDSTVDSGMSATDATPANISLTHIAVIGAGYVGLSNAILLAQARMGTVVTLYDIDKAKIATLRQRKSPLQESLISHYLSHEALTLSATDDPTDLYRQSDLVIIATPTNYDVATGRFDTRSVEQSIEQIRQQHASVPIVIKSTIPVGFTAQMREQFDAGIYFMPEFLREGQALDDNLHPTRLIIGAEATQHEFAQALLTLYRDASLTPDVPMRIMPATEAEAVKLFANSYLATRIAFFNELDSFAEKRGLNTHAIIDGMGLDPRIGQHYNNPSFGYGGYCLPKDTQQLKANYAGIPANLIHAIVDANSTRKRFIARQIVERKPHRVGVYRLSMKKEADNFRDSAVLDIIELLKQHGISISIYEPALTDSSFMDCAVYADLQAFLFEHDLIIANRWHEDLAEVADKVYSRDVFGYS